MNIKTFCCALFLCVGSFFLLPAIVDAQTLDIKGRPGASNGGFSSPVSVLAGDTGDGVDFEYTYTGIPAGSVLELDCESDGTIEISQSNPVGNPLVVHNFCRNVYNSNPTYTATGRFTQGGAVLVTDTLTVNVIGGNNAPVVDAGGDQTITLPNTTATLSGTISDDGLPSPPGTIQSISWTKISGPAATIANSSLVNTSVQLTGGAGTYEFQLSASDGDLTSTDTVRVNVLVGGGGGGVCGDGTVDPGEQCDTTVGPDDDTCEDHGFAPGGPPVICNAAGLPNECRFNTSACTPLGGGGPPLNPPETGIVPCGNEGQPACNFCHVFQAVNNVIIFLLVPDGNLNNFIPIIPVAAGLLLAIGGFFLFTGGVNPQNVARGKTIITAVIVGLFIIYGAWLFVDLLLNALGFINLGAEGDWYKISCEFM